MDKNFFTVYDEPKLFPQPSMQQVYEHKKKLDYTQEKLNLLQAKKEAERKQKEQRNLYVIAGILVLAIIIYKKK